MPIQSAKKARSASTFAILLFYVPLCFANCPTVPADLWGESIVAHGAIPGDNIDDSDAIWCAIAAALRSSRKVLIPAGVFTLEREIALDNKIYDRLEFEGAGWGAVIEHKDGPTAFRIGRLNNTVRNPEHVIFKNLFIRAVQNKDASAGISYNNANRAYVENLHIHGYNARNSGPDREGGAGIKYRNTWIHTVRNTYVTGSHHGIHAQGEGVVNALNIESSVFENITYGITLGRVVVVNIRNNTIESEFMHTGVLCAFACRNLNVTGNYFESPKAQGPERAVFIGNESSNAAILIEGNYAYMGGADSVIEIRNARGATISSNMLVLNLSPAMDFIRIGGNGLATEDVTISSNYVSELGKQTKQLKNRGVRYVKNDSGKVIPLEHQAR